LAWQLEENLRCGGCGQPLDVSTAMERDGQYEADYRTCFGCRAKERYIESDREHDTTAGRKYYVTLDEVD